MMICRATLVILAAGVSPPVQEVEDAAPSVAVMPIAARRVHPDTVAALDRLVLAAARGTFAGEIVGTTEIRDRLGEAAIVQAAGCNDAVCITEIGMSLGTDRLIAMTVGRLGDELILVGKLLDVKSSEVRARQSVTLTLEPRGHALGIESLVRRFVPRAGGPSRDTFVRSGIAAPDYDDFLRSGLRYDRWAARRNWQSESLALEIGKWTVTLFAGLAAVGTARGGADRQAIYWGGAGAIWVTALAAWAIDLAGIGDVPGELVYR